MSSGFAGLAGMSDPQKRQDKGRGCDSSVWNVSSQVGHQFSRN